MNIQLSDHFTYKKLLQFTLPVIAMMIFTSIYSVVDGFFVSNFAGDIPFKAINLIMPFLLIVATVGFMFGTGGSAIVSFTLGLEDKKKANEYFSLFVYVTFTLGLIFAVLSIVFIRPIASALGANGEILENCVLYGRIILCALPFVVLQFLFQSFFATAEKPHLGLVVIIAAGCTNMILDAVLVITLPQEFKLAGAAIATAVSQCIGGLIPLIYFAKKNSSIFRLGKTRFDGKILLKACTNGASEFMSNASMSIVGILYNFQLIKYAGDDGIAAYGVMMYVSMIFSAIFIGFSLGTAPIIGYHNGAGNYDELKGVLKKSICIISFACLIMLISSQALAVPLAKIFVGYNDELMQMTTHGLRVFAFSFLFMGFTIFASGFFTALGDGLTSALISFLRTFIFQVSAVLLLPIIFQVNGIWLSVVIADIMAVAVSVSLLILKKKKYNY